MTSIAHKTPNPIAHLSAADVEEIGRRLDAIRAEVLATRGDRDAEYIHRVIDAQRRLEIGSRAVLLGSLLPPLWFLGTAGLSVAKILENMEIGHNVLHGQWDWMRDPTIHSTTWEWDNATPSDMWKHSHNELHHTYTNVLGKDNDLGYGIMRVDEEQRWMPFYLGQPVWNLLNALFFQYGIAAYDLEIGKYLKRGKNDPVAKAEFQAQRAKVLAKVKAHAKRDYLVHPLLSGPSALTTMGANLTANLVRNVWTHSVIMCGHFPDGVETFEKASIDGETRGEWYVRQMLGAANITGGEAMHLMTGNLSFQIEHHLFPDLPSNRYKEIAPAVEALFDEFGLTYATGSLPTQLTSAWMKVVRLSLPNDLAAKAGVATDAVTGAVQGVTGAASAVTGAAGGLVRRVLGRRTPAAPVAPLRVVPDAA